MNIFKLYNILLLLFVTASISVKAQSEAGSNIASRTKMQASGNKYIEQRVYDNGLGDIIQETLSYPGTTLSDVVVMHEYDNFRRKTKTWLPVTSTKGGGFLDASKISSLANSKYSDSAPFTKTEYDNFLLSQPSAQFKAGSKWQNNGKKVTISYSYAEVLEMCEDDASIYTYPKVSYLCTRTIDEDGCMKAEYTSMSGKLMISETSQGKTYYIYNWKGDLRYVIPPVLSQYILSNYGKEDSEIADDDEMMQKYAFIYRYDNKRHCIYKKLPGCEPIYYIYDKTGNCILTQDGNQRQKGEWTYSLPDIFGRVCISGICHNNISYISEPLNSTNVYVEYDGVSATTGGYLVKNFTLDSQTLYSALYYDNYSFIGRHGFPSAMTASSVSGFSIDSSLGKGLQTGATLAIINDAGVSGYTYSTMYYDSRYNVVQLKSTNHLGRTDVTSTSYTYTGKPQKMVVNHDLRSSGDKETYTYSYDDADRITNVTHKIDSYTQSTLLHNSYNQLGQLTSATTGTHTTNYTYDMHSWLKSISASNQQSLFNENLKYADSDNPCYNGNISSMTWKNGTTTTQGYNYKYDDASRLVSAKYVEGNNANDKYSTQYSYDRMGNIISLKRNGLQDDGTYGLLDDLTLSYEGNRLIAVEDKGNDPTYKNAWNFADGSNSDSEYEYDANGNVIKDSNKGIKNIVYNFLNLPMIIEFTNGKTIKYTYSADGSKLRAEYTTSLPATTKRIDYCGNLLFENGKLQQINVEGGYATLVNTSWIYHYYIKDHLGNIRQVIHPSSWYEQPQINNYYPYGGLMANSSNQDLQRYKYNGKELDRMHGLDWYDYGARWMDGVIGRWHSMDPLCEKYYSVSPYAYCGNNPVSFIDPDGCDSIFASANWFNTKYKYIGNDGKNTGNVYVVKGATKRAVKAATKNGEDYNGDMSNLDEVALIPRGKTAETVYEQYTNADGLEEGGCEYEDGTIQVWDKGSEPYGFITENGEAAAVHSIEPYIVNGNADHKGKPNIFWHIHSLLDVIAPNGVIVPLGDSKPSGKDYDFESGTNPYKESTRNTFVVGQRTKRVTYYHNKHITISMSINKWLKLAGL